MATIEELKQMVDLHELAGRLGLESPQSGGNDRSPHHAEKTPSLSIYGRHRRDPGGHAFKDFSTDAGGDCVDLVAYVRGCDTAEAVRHLHELYGIRREPQAVEQRAPEALHEYIARKCLAEAPAARDWLINERGIAPKAVDAALAARTIGWNTYTNPSKSAGEFGHGGPAAAFIARSPSPGRVVAVDLRYADPALNGGVKTQTQGDKSGIPWTSDLRAFQRAKTVVIVESPINALSVDSAGLKDAAALAVRGTNVEAIDWTFLTGKQALICMDADLPGRVALV